MKKWALIVAGLYFLILAALSAPVIFAAAFPQASWTEAAEVYGLWPYWLWLVIMVTSQFALLTVPVRVASRRPITRNALWPTLLAGGFMMGGLVLGGVCCIYEFVVRDKGRGNWGAWVALALGALTWCVWVVVVSRMNKSVNTSDLVTCQCRWLFKGSILELLIAVPTHIVARYRGYCCAGMMTFVGLTMGMSVMLFAFGPALFFLFAERWKRLHPDGLDRETPENQPQRKSI